MGMYDTLNVEDDIDLPGFPINETRSFQTKDLDCSMDLLKITSQGRLVRENRRYETVPEEERPYASHPEEWMRSFGSVRLVRLGWQDTNYHGKIIFYTSVGKGDWYEYEAKFTDGNLVDIRPIEIKYETV